MSQIQSVVLFDMRAPAFGTPAPALYAAALDMASFADEIGVSRVNLMEHHSSEDGYLPSPFVMGGGVAARTKRCRICLGAVILPLHDPVKVAEEIAVLDQMSGGRLDVILGAGYVASEFAAFGVSLHDRARLLDEGIEIILRALHGERFRAGGREIFVRPRPIQAPEDILLVGGGVAASAKRAARFDLGISPLRPDILDLYDAECRKLGRQPRRKFRPSPPSNIHLAKDPEKAWQQVMPHIKHVVAEYAKWADAEPGTNSPFRGLLQNETALRQSGMFAVWTPEELVRKAPTLIAGGGSLSFMPLLGGLSPTIGWESLKLLEAVLPKLQAEARS